MNQQPHLPAWQSHSFRAMDSQIVRWRDGCILATPRMDQLLQGEFSPLA